MSCHENCQCRPGVIAFVFVPGIMGTRIKNKESGDTVWDPASGYDVEKNSETLAAEESYRQEMEQLEESGERGIFETHRKRSLSMNKQHDNHKRKKRKTKWLWDSVKDIVFAGPAKRKMLFVGETSDNREGMYDRNDNLLEVDSGSEEYFSIATPIPPAQIKLKKQRGWGEVLWGSYGEFLYFLEKKGQEFSQQYPGLRFPVFAIGYNWMLSNEQSGERVKQKLAEYREQIKAADERGLSDEDIKFIFITHSMGGFVTRSAFLLSGLESEVEAVIHGAMPHNGSVDTYTRMRAGQKGGTKIVIGKNAGDVTAILGFCQGGLELLPNQFYKTTRTGRPEWLFINTNNGKGGSQPLKVEYGSAIYGFYKNTEVWYRLVNPRLLAPERDDEKFNSESKRYINAHKTRIDKCMQFHSRLHAAGDFHNTTTLLYSNNPADKTHESATWVGKSELAGSVESWVIYDHQERALFLSKGKVKLTNQETMEQYLKDQKQWYDVVKTDRFPSPPTASFTLAKPSVSGDGTVHEGANKYAESVAGLNKLPLESTQDHQNFYNCPEVRKRVVNEILSWIPDIHQKLGG